MNPVRLYVNPLEGRCTPSVTSPDEWLPPELETEPDTSSDPAQASHTDPGTREEYPPIPLDPHDSPYDPTTDPAGGPEAPPPPPGSEPEPPEDPADPGVPPDEPQPDPYDEFDELYVW